MKNKNTVNSDGWEGRKILASTGCFYKWFESLPLSRQVDDHLVAFLSSGSTISGFEFSATFDALRRYATSLDGKGSTLPGRWDFLSRRARALISAFPDSTIHLSKLHQLSDEDAAPLADTMNQIFKSRGCSLWTFHPDQVSRTFLTTLLSEITSEISLCAENMDPFKKQFRTIEEMRNLLAELPQLGCTFDLSHWLAHGHDADAPELLAFLTEYQSQIRKIHLSVPTSRCKASKKIEDSGGHFLLTESGWQIPSSFFRAIQESVPIVLEGVIPVGHFDMLGDEILVASLTSTSTGTPGRKKGA